MTFQITMNAQYALDVQPFVSKEDARYYLCGFLIEGAGAAGLQITATDGARLGTFLDETGSWIENGEPVENRGDYRASLIMQLPKDILTACKMKAREGPRYLVIENNGPQGTELRVSIVLGTWDADIKEVAIERTILQTFVAPIDGTFPEFRRALPTSTLLSDSAAIKPGHRDVPAFNASYLADFGKVGRALKIWPHSEGDTNGPVYLTVGDRPDFLGVLMPMRSDAPSHVPSWIYPVGAVAAAPAMAAE